jgi:hypothetical protein
MVPRSAPLGLVGQGSEDQFPDGRRACRDGGDTAGVRRCLQGATMSYPGNRLHEWKKTGTAKQTYAIVSEGDPLFAFAGLREKWRDKKAGAGAEWIGHAPS